MFRIATLTLLALLAAGPASAQLRDGSCMPSQSDQVRCNLRTDLRDQSRSYSVIINIPASGPPGSLANTETYVGACGSAGQSIGRSSIAADGSSTVASFTIDPRERPAHQVQGTCVVTQIFNCTQGGNPTSCLNVIRSFSTKIELR